MRTVRRAPAALVRAALVRASFVRAGFVAAALLALTVAPLTVPTLTVPTASAAAKTSPKPILKPTSKSTSKPTPQPTPKPTPKPAAADPGSLDPSFGTKGTVSLPGGESLALGPGNTIWVLGSVIYTDGTSRYLNRLKANGAPDPTFTTATQSAKSADLSTGPLFATPSGGASFAVNKCCHVARPPTSLAAVQSVSVSGKTLAGGAGSTTWAIAKLVTKQAADTDYVLGGVVRLSDGRMRACVSVYPGADGDPFAALVGFTAKGAPDPSVGAADSSMPSPGWTRVAGLSDCGYASAGLQQLFVDGADRLYVAGTAIGVGPPAARVIRTSADGVVDQTYGVAGRATIASTTRSYTPLTGVVDTSGTLWLGLSSRETANGSSAVATVVKLTSNGVRDGGFGSHGVSRFFPKGGSSELNSIGALPAGRLVIGLVSTSGAVRTGQLRAIAAGDGSRSTSFGIAGTVDTNTLTWAGVVQGKNLLIIGNVLPRDPNAYLGASVLQRRKL